MELRRGSASGGIEQPALLSSGAPHILGSAIACQEVESELGSSFSWPMPSPHSVTVFWVGNFSSPWPVLAFFAGRSQRSWIWAVCTGAVAEVACVFGFYGRFLSLDPGGLGRDPSSLASPLACPSWWSPCSGRCGMVTSRAHSSSGSARSRLGCWFWPGWLRPLAALSPARSALPERLAIGSTPPAGVAQAQGDSCMFPLPPFTYHHQQYVGKVS